jgi:Domain of unknown function (DUF4258)
MHPPLTEHARARMQQRGITRDALELLLDFGRETHDHRGCTIVRFDKRSRRHVLRALGPEALRRMERYFNAYAVVAEDDAVVTVGHRLRSTRARRPAQRTGIHS